VAEPSLLECFVRPLNTSAIRYFVTGGLATIIYGEPRFTRGIDLVLAIGPADAQRFLGLWPPDEYYAPPEDSFVAESARPAAGHFNVVHTETGLVADCYVAGDDPLHAWAFDHINWLNVQDLRVPVAPVEYVIVRKLSYFAQSGSTRHLEDIARMRRVQGQAIDSLSLERWIDRLGVRDAWTRAAEIDVDQH
jgi:hypothetical protein